MKSRRVLLAALLLLSATLSSAQEDQGEALRGAAREGNLGRLEELLAAGVPVDAPNRYGATALFFAADRDIWTSSGAWPTPGPPSASRTASTR